MHIVSRIHFVINLIDFLFYFPNNANKTVYNLLLYNS